MGRWIVVGAALLLAGCGEAPISMGEARGIASLSQDADKHLAAFTSAIQELSKEESCQPDYMRDQGGFWRVSGKPFYFIHCGTLYSESNVQTWYYDPHRQKLARVKAAL